MENAAKLHTRENVSVCKHSMQCYVEIYTFSIASAWEIMLRFWFDANIALVERVSYARMHTTKEQTKKIIKKGSNFHSMK